MRAIFDDGADATGDVLIGAAASTRRPAARADRPECARPVHAGLINLGGYARGVQVDAEPGSYTMVFGRRAFLRLGST